MKTAVFAYSRQGCSTAKRIIACLDGEIQAYTMARFAGEDFFSFPQTTQKLYENCFHWADAIVFVGSCGIAVRKIAPYVKNKSTDPAVIVVDELGRFTVSLLSGHIGGANVLTLNLAKKLGATPVITTATDINDRFSVDSWATKQGLLIDDLKAAKMVSAAILEGEVPLHSDFFINGKLPNGIFLQENGRLGISITYRRDTRYCTTLRLIPKILHMGIGCRRGTSAETILEVVQRTMDENRIDLQAVQCIASIDLKADEVGLLEFCKSQKLPVSFYSSEILNAVKGDFTPSEFVRSITGVDNICERAALIGAEKLIVRKQARNGVTVAIAAEKWEVRFE